MTSLLRQIVAGPRAKHQETGLDLCYVTSNIIATSGPSQTYPQRAYRNPLDQLVAFLAAKHGSDWAIWEFRAEGTGYPDEAVYNRIRHYPWPDHHPPPFRLVPMIIASMRNWLSGAPLDGRTSPDGANAEEEPTAAGKKGPRVVVVHCKAGKGRSGTMACSYLVAECGWRPEDALARFTERRMRPKFGAGVSIPSQLRWISYVDRWTKGGKVYVDREVEVVEVQVWGLRHGVKVSIQGFVEDGKKIRVFHTFKRDERHVIEGDAPGGGGMIDLVTDMAGYAISPNREDEHGGIRGDKSYNEIADNGSGNSSGGEAAEAATATSGSGGDILSRFASLKPIRATSKRMRKARDSGSMDKLSPSPSSSTRSVNRTPAQAPASPSATSLPAADHSSNPSRSQPSLLAHGTGSPYADSAEPGGQVVIFKPVEPIRLPNSDVNLSLERRNRAPASMGLTMVTAVAHVWFNAFFEGKGPEQGGRADDSGVFQIRWDAMDGIKGSSQKGTRAAEKIAIVWRAACVGKDGEKVVATTDDDERPDAEASGLGPQDDGTAAGVGIRITEPGLGSPVPQMEAADWKGGNRADPEGERGLGLRSEEPDSAGVSKASSLKSEEIGSNDEAVASHGEVRDDDSLKGVKVSGPSGEEGLPEVAAVLPPSGIRDDDVGARPE